MGAWGLELSGGRGLGAAFRAGVGAGAGRALGTAIKLAAGLLIGGAGNDLSQYLALPAAQRLATRKPKWQRMAWAFSLRARRFPVTAVSFLRWASEPVQAIICNPQSFFPAS